LALGRHLVEELRLEPGVDTLGRWMAHHLADLVTHADKASDRAGRAAAKRQAVETILHIWKHRAVSDRINPLLELQPVLRVLCTLSQENAPWVHISGIPRRDAARRVYDLLRRLTICLSLIDLNDIQTLRKGLMRASRTAQYHSWQERGILSRLSAWVDVFRPNGRRNRAAQKSKAHGKSRLKHTDFASIAAQIVEEATEALGTLKLELQGEHQK